MMNKLSIVRAELNKRLNLLLSLWKRPISNNRDFIRCRSQSSIANNNTKVFSFFSAPKTFWNFNEQLNFTKFFLTSRRCSMCCQIDNNKFRFQHIIHKSGKCSRGIAKAKPHNQHFQQTRCHVRGEALKGFRSY